ncbi:MAG: hypothetical protein ABIL01_13980 [Pseudomonadota bacterium]
MASIVRKKYFDTSGKSPAQLYHPPNLQMLVAVPDNRIFGSSPVGWSAAIA